MREHRKTTFARTLRRNMTDAERRLWVHLRRRQVGGNRFRRQHAIGPYIVDFACLDARVIIEVDGGQHLDSKSDARRDAWFARNGYAVLRFWNHDVLNRTKQVLEAIYSAISGAGPHPDPPP